MTLGDDGAPEGPANANTPAAAPRPKPPTPGGPPRPGIPSRVTPAPPVAAVAKPPPPPARESNPFLAPESSREVDDSWLALDEAAEAPPAPPPPPPPPPPPSSRRMVAAPPAPEPPPAPWDVPPAPPPIATVEPIEQTPIVPIEVEPAKPQSVGDSASTLSDHPFKKKSRAKPIAFMLLAVLLLAGGGFAYQSQMNARSASVERAPQPSAEATVEAPVSTSEPAPPPTYTAEPPPSPSAAKKKPAAGGGVAPTVVSADPATQAIIDTTQLPAGRKIVVDGHFVGTSPRKVPIRCGTHRIVIGDWPPESIAFPCGGEVNFTD